MRIETDPRYLCLYEKSREFGDYNACSVVAIAAATDVSYEEAYATLKRLGRENGRGTTVKTILAGVEMCECTHTRVDPRHFLDRYPGIHSSLKNVTTHHPDRFNRVWADGKTYLLFTKNHVLTVKDGTNLDWTRGSSKRVTRIYRIHKGEPR